MQPTLKEPSRPVTQENRSLFQMPDGGGSSSSRPTSGYSVEQLSFVRDTYGSRSDSRGSRCSRSGRRPETIAEDEEGYRREGVADVLRLDDDEDRQPRPHPGAPVAGGLGGRRLLRQRGAHADDPRGPSRRPGAAEPSASSAAEASRRGLPRARRRGAAAVGRGYPEQPPPVSVADLSPRARRQLGQADAGASVRKRASDGSPRRRKTSRSPAPPAAGDEAAGDRPATGSDAVPGGSGTQWDAACEAVIAKLQSFAASKDRGVGRAQGSCWSCASTSGGWWPTLRPARARGRGTTRSSC
ncbi:unnamed protein product [Prorocentrum cordatum]|uniref:Uncharacterized protein n=1 Tax=Prorocentrum cordatum TaxID=2364126 RepID=A0ABN9WHE1_9DINO|nr:unnamed protein product [Polarella glacialis]